MPRLQKPLLKSFGQRFWAGTADESAGCNGIPVLDQFGSLLSGKNPDFFHSAVTLFLIISQPKALTYF
jgi:hypothetical protein